MIFRDINAMDNTRKISKYVEMSRILRQANMHTIELSGAFH